jgi:zinc protease
VAEEHERRRRRWKRSPDVSQRGPGVNQAGQVGRTAGENTITAIFRQHDDGPGARVQLDGPWHHPFGKVRVAVKRDHNGPVRSWATDEIAVKWLSIVSDIAYAPGFCGDHRGRPNPRGLEDQALLVPPDEKNHGHADPKDKGGGHKEGRERKVGHNSKTRVPEFTRALQVTVMQIPIETFELSNGLRVTLSEDHTAPIVGVNLWYHVGSANERPGRTGFAHLFEHMLFQGSAEVAANEHFELIQRAGGTLNGSTWLDRTNYFEVVPSNQCELVLWLEANRMGQLLPAMTQEKLDTQRDVVKNERRWSVDNQPYGTWWERLPALCFPADHPFHHSLIGSMEDLSRASLEDVAEFFRVYYTPDNAVLSVAGDFDPPKVRAWIEKYFGGIERGAGQRDRPETSVAPVFGRGLHERVPDDVALPRLFLAFRSPVFGSEAYYAASVCAAVLGLRSGSRLFRRLVREQEIAAEASAFTFDLPKGSDLLVLDVTGQPGTSAEQLHQSVVAEVESVHKDGVTTHEVSRAAALIETDLVRALQSAGERADRLSMFATYFGDPRHVNEQLTRYQAVTVEDVNAFIRARLGPDNRASLLYVPREADEAAGASVPRVEA